MRRVLYEAGAEGSVTTEDISHRVRAYTLDVTQKAEEGSVALSSMIVDDPDGDYDIVGWRRAAVYEDLASASNTLIGLFWVADRKVIRGPHRNLAGRQWVVSLADSNALLSFRVMTGADANRPAETDVARMQWLLGTNEMNRVTITDFVNTTGGVAMDAVDYRGQYTIDIVNDCAQASGKNFFIYDKDTPTGAGTAIWYDFASSTSYTSSLRLTNDASEVDNVLTFAITDDSELTRDPSRVYSGAYVRYDGGSVYDEDTSTSNFFTRRDGVVPADNVKSNAKAAARATRYLAEMDTEDDRITCGVYLPAAKVNWVRHGQRVQFKATHMPGYEAYSYLRVLSRTVKEVSEEWNATTPGYLVTLELSIDDPVSVDPGQGAFYRKGDNDLLFYVNGTFVGDNSVNDHTAPFVIPDGLLVVGTNVVAAHVTNGVEPAGWNVGNETYWEGRVFSEGGALLGITSASTKVWPVSWMGDDGLTFTNLGGTPSGWDEADFDDSGWDTAEDVTGSTANLSAVPPIAPARLIAPAFALSGNQSRGLIWLARMTFTV